MFTKNQYESIFKMIMFFGGVILIVCILLVIAFVSYEGIDFFRFYNFIKFIFGEKWSPTFNKFGILPMIISSLLITFCSLAFAIPIAISTAIYLAELSNKFVATFLRPVIQILAGIPSVVYGFFGIKVIVPIIREKMGGSGFSILASSIVLGIMILPIIINISEVAIKSVPYGFKEASFALGATHWQTISRVILPSCKNGIISSIILAMGRAIGETMAVIMVCGNSPKIPKSILDQSRTLTSNIAIEMGYASGMHSQALFATGFILLIIILILSTFAQVIVRKKVKV